MYKVPVILLTESIVPPTTPFNNPPTPLINPFPKLEGSCIKAFVGSFTNSKNPLPILSIKFTGFPIKSVLPNIFNI